MKTQLKTMATLLVAALLACSSGCQKETPNNGGNNNGNGGGNGGGHNGGGNSGGGAEEGMYLGIIGFNDALTTKSISLLNTSTENGFTNFIRGLNMRDGTALYHADNTALDWLQNATLPPDLINVSLVTFTDGLDNGSLILNNNYSSQSEFLNAVNNRILNDRVGGKSIDAYAIGMKGNDVQDYASFQQNLRKLSSDPMHNVYEVEDWDEVKRRFREIAIQLYNETTTVSTNVKIPGGKDNGTIIRITFDNVSNANTSTQYIQGTYTYENGKGKLSNVNYYGLQSSSGSTVVSDRQDGICFWYTFAELKTPNGNAVNNTDHMNLWYYNSNTTSWQHETEFTPSSYSNVSVERKSAVTVLVLDCTTSLGSDFEKMKEAAIEFVEVLDHYGENGNGGGNNGGNGGGNNGGGGNDTENKFIINNIENAIDLACITTLDGMSSLGMNVKSMLFTSADRKRSFIVSYFGDQVVDGEHNLSYLGTPYLPIFPCVHVALDCDFWTFQPQMGYIAKSGTLKVNNNNDGTKTVIMENLKLKNVENDDELSFPILDGFLQYHGYM